MISNNFCEYVGIFHDFFKQITSSFSFCEKDIVQIYVIHRRNIATLVIPCRLPNFNFGLSKSKWYLQQSGIKRSLMYHVALNWLFLIKVKNESDFPYTYCKQKVLITKITLTDK